MLKPHNTPTVQWGFIAAGTGGRSTVTFPISFSSSVYSLTLGEIMSGNDDYGCGGCPAINNGGPTKTDFTISHDTSGHTGTQWIAIGK